MAVKKSVLEQMSDRELENYIKPETTFVPEATKIAFEILKTRGRAFSAEEIDSINLLINKKEEKKVISIHPNNSKSSNLIYLSAVLSFIVLLLPPNDILNNLFSNLFSLLFVAFLATLVRRGYNWVKYLMLVSFALCILFIKSIIFYAINFPLIGVINFFVMVLQVYATILIFRIPKGPALVTGKSNLE
ncbi:hypothetical protein [Flavobacterium sp. 245]|uniref:hypothetical protein n=1 Tax=Flavobacterium sp. 245 TaxID=2512115 RepID=UPI00105EE358|nr:hypothetical protein [Flavobacterium sp. 245]TDP02100.1 hypothetical protein EV145_10378 [Flavobacterium sp. 245]